MHTVSPLVRNSWGTAQLSISHPLLSDLDHVFLYHSLCIIFFTFTYLNQVCTKMRKPVLVWHTTQFVAQLDLGIPAELNIHALAVSLSSHHYMERHQSQLRVCWLLCREAAARANGHHHLHRAGHLKEDEPWDSWFPLQGLEGVPFLNIQRSLPFPCLWPSSTYPVSHSPCFCLSSHHYMESTSVSA